MSESLECFLDSTEKKTELSFERAFQKLDELLKKLNSAETPLEEALLCYEEADQLIAVCSKRLGDAEKRLEKVVKNRQGEVIFDEKGIPKTELFSSY